MALRNHPSVNGATKARILRIAQEIGYHPNPLVSSLMAQIRTGRHVKDQGCLAVVVGRKSMEAWRAEEAYRGHCEGIQKQAQKLGYTVEFFFVEDGWTSARLDRVLYSRGIQGVLFAAPQISTKAVILKWERYTCLTIGFGYAGPNLCRVSAYHERNMDIAYQELLLRGYQKPGVCLPSVAAEGRSHGWFTGFLHGQAKLSPENRIPLFIDKPGEQATRKRFFQWFKHYRPDAIIALSGVPESARLEALGQHVPGDVGLVAFAGEENSNRSRVVENHEVIGATAVELLASQLYNNERGLPVHSKFILIEGSWIEGKTLRPRLSTKNEGGAFIST
jgi:LacI family transcriptional regulator